MAHALLNHSNLRIVTNNLNVANTLMAKEDFRIILAGGELRSRDGGIMGEATLDFISQFRLDFGILGISGIDSDGSLLEFDYHEVRTKRAIIENSRHVMLVVDHSKFGRNAMVNMGSISMVDAVYTDTLPPAGVMQVIADHHIQLELCYRIPCPISVAYQALTKRRIPSFSAASAHVAPHPRRCATPSFWYKLRMCVLMVVAATASSAAICSLL